MDLAGEMAVWQAFYLASAGASAVLLGLIFVGMSLHYRPTDLDRRLVAMATDSAVPLFYATLTCLVMLVPVAEPTVPTAALVLVGLLAASNAGAPLFGRWYSGATRPRPGHRKTDRLRFVAPVVAGLSLVPAGLALLLWPEPALYAVGLIVLALIALGMQNAWDTLLRRDLRGTLVDTPGSERTN